MTPGLPSIVSHAALLLLAATLAACAPARNDMNTPTSDVGVAQDDADEQGPRRKLNPEPKRAYRITLTIADAPGPFASVEGVAQYDVDNDSTCGKIIPETGVAGRITTLELFNLVKVTDTRYEGTIYADQVLDEDYYGRGICRWSFTRVQVVLKATGAPGETEFLPSIYAEEVFAGQSVTKYFWKQRYPRSKTDNFPSFGEAARSEFSDEIGDEDLFALTLSATEAP